MDFKICDIGLAKDTLAWQHTAFQPRDPSGHFRIGKEQEIGSKDHKPPPARKNPIATLNVPLSKTADFVVSHRVCCIFYAHHQPIHCRSPPLCLILSKIRQKGGSIFVDTENAEKYTLEYQRHIRYQFESFCKKVIHGERCDYIRWLLRHTKHETNFSALPPTRIDSCGHTKEHRNPAYIFEICGYSVTIQDECLADSLLEFTDMERGILLLTYSLELSEQVTGNLLGLSRSCVHRLKKKLLAELQKKMKE